jgi:hypothetical protein
VRCGVRGVYNRAQYAEQRKEMLQKWADYVEELHGDKGQAVAYGLREKETERIS